MNEALFRKLLERPQVPVPGDSSFVSSLGQRNGSVEVAVVHHHRLAFYYWLHWTTSDWSRSLPTEQLAPDLVTVDWHDDVGCEADCVFDELRSLVLPLEVDNVNDPACLDLNAIGNVYVLYKQRGKESHRMTDQYGHEHETHYVKAPGDLLKRLDKAGPHLTYFDLDVDYFFRQGRGSVHGAEVMVPEAEIRSLLDLRGEFMTQLSARPVRGVTLALEPTYCGGLNGCFRALSVICETLFEGSLLGDKVGWRKPNR